MTSADYLSIGATRVATSCDTSESTPPEVDYRKLFMTDSIRTILEKDETFLYTCKQIDSILAFFEKTLGDSDFIKISKYTGCHGLRSIKNFTNSERSAILSNIDRTDIYEC